MMRRPLATLTAIVLLAAGAAWFLDQQIAAATWTATHAQPAGSWGT